MAKELAVWLYEDHVATVSRESNTRLRLRYTEEALAKNDLGIPLLSIGLPLTDTAYPNAKTRSFLDGLLPEGEQRRAVAEKLDLNANDTFGLLRALGLDCAGAIVIQPIENTAPKPATTTTALPLDDQEIADRVANLKNAPLGLTDRVRISLAGVQEKLLLTRMPDGSWGEPVDGTPSTHILKPEIRDFPDTVENEAFCMRLAHNLGIHTAAVETTEYGGRKLLVVERFDRIVTGPGKIERIHQEDFCQVFGLPPRSKYQDAGGPSLKQISAVLRQFAPPNSLNRLLKLVFVNVLVGNSDAHGKNISIVHHRDGSIELTPLYDVLSTLYYVQGDLSMFIDNVHKTAKVARDRLVNEAVSWGMREESVRLTISELCERVPDALAAAIEATPGLPAKIPKIVASQLTQLGT